MDTVEFEANITKLSVSFKPFALTLTKDSDDAEDLMQDTVYRALASRNLFSDGTNLKAWVYTIMKNIFINNYRRKKKRNAFLEVKEDLSALKGWGATAVNDGEGNMELTKLMEKINQLGSEFRVPFMMHYDGFKYKEIADDMKLPIGTVKSRIHFARKLLQKELTGIPVYHA